jgi:hypothetical protein
MTATETGLKASDLRIGNSISFKGECLTVECIERDNVIIQITAISNEGEAFMGESNFFEPIALTPEILEKVGLRLQHGEVSIYINGRLGTIAYLKNEGTDESFYIPNRPQSLHQLQNLYHALTGEELEITLP